MYAVIGVLVLEYKSGNILNRQFVIFICHTGFPLKFTNVLITYFVNILKCTFVVSLTPVSSFSWLVIKSVAQQVKLLWIKVWQVNMNVIGIVQQFVQAGPVP